VTGGQETVGLRVRASGRKVAVVSLPEDAREAARRLYAELRQADREVDVIGVNAPAESGLGLAVADRLRKASGPRCRRS
jgi:L-threonylcarbamoyladenylate synthase